MELELELGFGFVLGLGKEMDKGLPSPPLLADDDDDERARSCEAACHFPQRTFKTLRLGLGLRVKGLRVKGLRVKC